jgi:hypothetical protein
MTNQSDQLGQLAASLAAVQSRLPAAVKDKQNPHMRNRYADLGSVWDAARDLLPEYGLAVVQRGVNLGGLWGLETVLLHASGEWIGGITPLLCAPGKGTSEMQALGSAITYARRYGLAAILGVVSEEDDDGHGAGRREAPSRPQERPAPPPTNGMPRGRPDPWEVEQQDALAEWGRIEGPPATEADYNARRGRLINDVVTAALAAGRIQKADVAKPDKPDVRSSTRSRDAARRLFEQDPAWVRLTISEHLERIGTEAKGAR